MLLNNFRILCTGNPNKPGIARQLVEQFSNTDCLSLSTGVDLLTPGGLHYFKSIIINYNVFVNISRIPNRTQEILLRLAHKTGMQGHVFNIGSIAEYKRWEWYDTNYTEEKRSLREASLELCSEQFKTTHIIVGGFQDYEDTHVDRMDPKEIVNMITYILQAPINIPVVGIEKIIDKQMEEHLNDKLRITQKRLDSTT
jgi:hypothetical protein